MEIKDGDRSVCPGCAAPTIWATTITERKAVPLDAEPDLSGRVRLDYIGGELTAQVVPHFEREQTIATYGPLYRRHSVLCGTGPATAEGS
jgi:hypothetical protein